MYQRSTIRVKTGICPMCGGNKKVPLIGKFCQQHYWDNNRRKSAAKFQAKLTGQSDKQTVIDDCDAMFSQVVRLSHADKHGMVECYTCGTKKHWKQMQCGHFIPRIHMLTRFSEDNCKPQCPTCNLLKDGNLVAFARLYLAQLQFLSHYYGSGGQHSSIEQPAPTIPTKARTALIDAQFFIDKHYGKNAQNQSIEQPAGTIVTNDKHRLVECQPFIMPTNFDNKPVSIEQPAPTITANRKHHYLVNPSHGGHCTSTDQPCPVIIARQDKAPLYIVQAESGPVAVAVYEGDTEIMIRIKQFMAAYGIVDIKMRMLRVKELLSIQGFPEGYKLEGNQADQKKFIGNSVVPLVVQRWTEALGSRLIETYNQKIA